MPGWCDVSEIVVGLILQNRLSINSVRPELFFGEYKNMVAAMKNGVTEPEDLIMKVGLSPFNAALDAAKTLNGAGEMADWIAILEQSAIGYEVGIKLEKLGRRFQSGSDVDWAKVEEYLNRAKRGIPTNFVPLSEIKGEKANFTPSGWKAIDTHLGGWPEVGMGIVGGNPGSGKTTWLTKAAACYARAHPNKKVGIFSIEMLSAELKYRFSEIEHLDDDVMSRIVVDDTPVTPEQAINKASTIDNLGLLITDFADLMIRGETSESAMAHIYRTYMIGAKELHCTNILLSQLNRNYKGGLPRPFHLRYTSLAEALAWMILMIYNPATDYFEDDDTANDALPIIDNSAYIIAWKVRGGFINHLDDNPGAILLPFRGNKGWANKEGKWFSLAKYS